MIYPVNCILNKQIGVRDFKYMGKNLPPTHMSRDTSHMRSGCKRIFSGILWEMSELITQERTAVRSSNLVKGLTIWPAMYDHWPRSNGQMSRSQGQERCNYN